MDVTYTASTCPLRRILGRYTASIKTNVGCPWRAPRAAFCYPLPQVASHCRLCRGPPSLERQPTQDAGVLSRHPPSATGPLFTSPKPVIAMVHVGALPGTPASRETLGELEARAVAECAIYREAGVHG